MYFSGHHRKLLSCSGRDQGLCTLGTKGRQHPLMEAVLPSPDSSEAGAVHSTKPLTFTPLNSGPGGPFIYPTSAQRMTLNQVLCLLGCMKPSTCPEELWARGELEKQIHNKLNTMTQVSRGADVGGQ